MSSAQAFKERDKMLMRGDGDDIKPENVWMFCPICGKKELTTL